jgi:DNA-binding GntR family transcriptional regulator
MEAIPDQLYKVLRKEIIFGKLMPGERITENQLCQRFSCSRSPVREALSRLHTEGFVEVLPRRGAVVTKTSPEEVNDYYALLKVLEGQAVEWAAPRLTPAELDELDEINKAMRQIKVDSQTSIEDWVRLNLAFHQMFRLRCGNLKMDWLVEEIRSRITRSLYTSLMVPAFDEYVEDHEQIIKQLRAGRADLAGQAMIQHVERAQKVLGRFLVSDNNQG